MGCAYVCLCLLALAGTVAATGQSDGDVGPSDLSVHAFYYLWYGNPEHDERYIHWDHRVLPHWKEEVRQHYKHLTGQAHHPPDDIHAPFYPSRGCYSSRDPATLRAHFRQMDAFGVDVAVVSWTGRGNAVSDTEGVSTDKVLPLVLEIAAEFRVQIAIHLEPYPHRNPTSVKADISYLLRRHGQSPALHRRPARGAPRPVFYIYDAYHNAKEEWARVLCDDGPDTLRGTPHDAFVIGTLLGKDEKTLITRGCFDGAYSYFATDGFTHGSTSHNWKGLVEWATGAGKVFIPSVGPGYNDTKIRPWNRPATRGRRNGAYFRTMMDRAINSGAKTISITSYNEWGEGTQIEPSTDYEDPEMYLKQVLRTKRAARHRSLGQDEEL